MRFSHFYLRVGYKPWKESCPGERFVFMVKEMSGSTTGPDGKVPWSMLPDGQESWSYIAVKSFELSGDNVTFGLVHDAQSPAEIMSF